jgi:hypothetical protein
MKTRNHDSLSRDQLLERYEYGVWLFLAVVGGGGMGLLTYLGYVLL